MQITSIIAIYSLFWVISAFVVLPFGIQTPDQSGEKVLPGHDDSAPTNFRPGKVVLRATLLAAILFGVFYINYLNGWIGTGRSEEHTSELQSLMRITYAVFCLKKKKSYNSTNHNM